LLYFNSRKVSQGYGTNIEKGTKNKERY